MTQPLNTHLFIQRLVHLVVSDPCETEATEQSIKALAAQYNRDKFARLPPNKRDEKLRSIDAALHREVPLPLYHKAHVTVEAALKLPVEQPRNFAPVEQGLVRQKTVQDQRERALLDKEKQLTAREAELREREELLQAQVASLQEWESRLAQRDALFVEAAEEAPKALPPALPPRPQSPKAAPTPDDLLD